MVLIKQDLKKKLPKSSTSQEGIVQLGTTASTACQGNDSRLSDSRVPKFTDIGASSSNEKDLNTYRTGGFYYINSDANSKHIDHCPLPKANNLSFFLLVETWGASNNNYVKQTLTYYTTGKTYVRTKTGNNDANTNWRAWKNISDATEYIAGTHGTTATNAWTGTSETIHSLEKGQIIFFRMTSAGTSSGATLNLTLPDGTTTGAKGVYYNAATRFTTHLPQNTVLCLIYDGANWINIAIQNTNYYDRMIYGSQITAGEALTANTLVYAKTDGKYYKVANGGTLDIRYPIIYNTQEIAQGNNHYNNYNIFNIGVNIQNTLSGKTITAYQNCYLEGTLSNNIFTITNNVFVSNGATTNGKYYILLGMAVNTTTVRFNSFEGKIIYKCIDNNHTLIPVSNWNTIENKPSSFTPSSHASTATTYGVATTANYGHTKVVQNLTTDDGNGLALGAGQGKALKTAIDGKSTVSVSPTKTSGIEIGKITVDGTTKTLYQQDNNTTYSAGTGLTLSGTSFSLTDASNYVKKSSTSGYIKNDGSIGTPTISEIGGTITKRLLVYYTDGSNETWDVVTK